MTATEILRTLASIRSLSGDEAAAADALQAILAGGGVEVHRFENNVWCSVGRGEDVLLLNSHLDVVPPSDNHPFPPFQPTEKDGWLYGRGTVDAKGSVSAMAATLLALQRDGYDRGRVVGAFTACEETGWPYNGLQQTRPHLPPLSAAIVGEPTDLQPCIAQKGLLILRLDARGRSAHAARPHLGDNAVLRAARDLLKIEALKPERVHPLLGPVTITPTVIEGGTVRNLIPELCSFYLDVRSTPSYTHDELAQLVRDAVDSDVVVHSERMIAVGTPENARVTKAAVAGSGGTPFGSPTASDWIFLSDIPVVKMGPGSSNLSHTADERIRIDELERAVTVYRETIEHYFA
ncbi:MAG: M20/M25/M40 family metallo-hydrolase [Rhodothermales bacterium]|nr:M20/M25/M40 family metallo-hydrolase [Rhodothermales bacterium]MBO6779379.1 M20/M25/M40 family metallo-hydrolase [Rhodothermales bacterium]